MYVGRHHRLDGRVFDGRETPLGRTDRPTAGCRYRHDLAGCRAACKHPREKLPSHIVLGAAEAPAFHLPASVTLAARSTRDVPRRAEPPRPAWHTDFRQVETAGGRTWRIKARVDTVQIVCIPDSSTLEIVLRAGLVPHSKPDPVGTRQILSTNRAFEMNAGTAYRIRRPVCQASHEHSPGARIGLFMRAVGAAIVCR